MRANAGTTIIPMQGEIWSVCAGPWSHMHCLHAVKLADSTQELYSPVERTRENMQAARRYRVSSSRELARGTDS